MQFSGGMPGTSRKDKRTTEEVKREKSLGTQAGKWIAELYPPGAMDEIASKIDEARNYHYKVTFPFVSKGEEEPQEENEAGKKSKRKTSGMGILPALLIPEYREKMRVFKNEVDHLVESTFLHDPQKWIDWAVNEHNGTFEPKNYPGCVRDEAGTVTLDIDKFRDVMRKKFYVRSEVMPVPNAEGFTQSLSELLGTDAHSVDLRVADAEKEAQRELLKRLIGPVQKMAEKLTEQPKGKQKDVVFRDTLIGNIAEIVELAPKMNLTGDIVINAFVDEMKDLTKYTPEDLRDDKGKRNEAAEKAADIMKRMSGYKL